MPPVMADDLCSNEIEILETRMVNVLVSKTNVQYKMTFRVPVDEDPLENVTEGMQSCLNDNEVCQDIKIYKIGDKKYQFEYVVMLEYEETVKFDADLLTVSDFNTTDNLLMASLYKYLDEEHLVKKLKISGRDEKPASYSPPESVMEGPPDTPIRSFFPLKKMSSSCQIIDDTFGTIQLDESPVLSGPKSRKRTLTKKIITIYPPPPAQSGIVIRINDYRCLSDGEYLNDTIIDFYIRYLCEELSFPDRERVHVFSTQFYTRLVERGLENIDKWTKGVDIFSKDVIFVPINEHKHWYLAIICFGVDQNNDDQEDKSKISPPCIIIMDSLSGEQRPEVVKNFKKYLSYESRAKKQIDVDFSQLKVGYPSLPRQPNLTDCGVYLLQYVECFLKDFLNDSCPVNLEGWFDHSLVRTKRKELANLICSLVSDYNEVSISELPELKFNTSTESSSGTPPSKKSRVYEVFRSEKPKLQQSPARSSFAKTPSSSLKPEERKNSLIQINSEELIEQSPTSPERFSNQDLISSETSSKNSCNTLPTSPEESSSKTEVSPGKRSPLAKKFSGQATPTSPEASLSGTEVSPGKRSTLDKKFSGQATPTTPKTSLSDSKVTRRKRPREIFSEPRWSSPLSEPEVPSPKWKSFALNRPGLRKEQIRSSTKRSISSAYDDGDDDQDIKWWAFVNNRSPKKRKVTETPHYITYSGKTQKSYISSSRTFESSSIVSSSSASSSVSSSGRSCSPYGQRAYEDDWVVPTHVSYQQFKNAKEVAGNDLEKRRNLKSFKKIISKVPTV